MLQLIVAITQEARKRYDVDVARAKREGEQEPSPRFAFNKFALQLEENKMLLEWIDVKHSNWDEDIEMVRKVYTAITSSDFYADYVAVLLMRNSPISTSTAATVRYGAASTSSLFRIMKILMHSSRRRASTGTMTRIS